MITRPSRSSVLGQVGFSTSRACFVVRQASGRRTYGLARATGLLDAQLTVLCAAASFTAADRLASAVIAALENVTSVLVLGSSVTVRQEGDDTGTAEPDGSAFTRIIGFSVSISV